MLYKWAIKQNLSVSVIVGVIEKLKTQVGLNVGVVQISEVDFYQW